MFFLIFAILRFVRHLLLVVYWILQEICCWRWGVFLWNSAVFVCCSKQRIGSRSLHFHAFCLIDPHQLFVFYLTSFLHQKPQFLNFEGLFPSRDAFRTLPNLCQILQLGHKLFEYDIYLCTIYPWWSLQAFGIQYTLDLLIHFCILQESFQGLYP